MAEGRDGGLPHGDRADPAVDPRSARELRGPPEPVLLDEDPQGDAGGLPAGHAEAPGGDGQGSLHPDPDVRVRGSAGGGDGRRRFPRAAATGALRPDAGPADAPGKTSQGKPTRAGAHVRSHSLSIEGLRDAPFEHRDGRGHQGAGFLQGLPYGRGVQNRDGEAGMTMEKKVNIMVVDDEEIVRASLTSWLEEDGYRVEAVESGRKALERLPERDWDLMLVDLKMPGMAGMQLMDEVHKTSPEMLVIIMTAYATVDTAVKAMKKGAYDYFVKPFNPDDISLTIRKIVDHHKLVQENQFLRKELKKQYKLRDMISKNEKMLEIFDLARTVAQSSSTVLIQGESGTGKELLARAIHDESPRMNSPFISVSCASLTESLLESELFGHEKGAFTGATVLNRGKLELAQDGTLFLDEIGDISLKLQMDLLRVLEQREFRRVGGSELIPINSRIIAATNRDLAAAIEAERFRADLYYRLNVISIHIPPLRERREDIPLLVDHFIEKFNIEMGKEIRGISEGAVRILMGNDWPGNARELRNVIERAVVVTKGNIVTESDISLPSVPSDANHRTKSLEEIEKAHIRVVLNENQWNIVRSAHALGIDRVTLYNKIKKFGLKKEGVAPKE